MKQKQEKASNKYDRNNQLVCRGLRQYEAHNDLFGMCTFGYRDVQYWDIATKSWTPLSKDADKFIIASDDPETIIESFWDKWRAYCLKRFKTSFIKLEDSSK